MAWPWPFLQRRASQLSLTSGTGTKTVGAGSGGVTGLIQRIYDPIYIYTSDKLSRGMIRFRELAGEDVAFDEDARPTTQIGMPNTVKGRPTAGTWGSWDLIVDPIPDRNYLISFDYTIQPSDINGTTDIPLYPNDRTMVHLVAAMALAHMGDERAGEMREIAAAMTVDDRMKYGRALGINDSWGLDKDSFR